MNTGETQSLYERGTNITISDGSITVLDGYEDEDDFIQVEPAPIPPRTIDSERKSEARSVLTPRQASSGSFLDPSAFQYLGYSNSDDDICYYLGDSCGDPYPDEGDDGDSGSSPPTSSGSPTSSPTKTPRPSPTDVDQGILQYYATTNANQITDGDADVAINNLCANSRQSGAIFENGGTPIQAISYIPPDNQQQTILVSATWKGGSNCPTLDFKNNANNAVVICRNRLQDILTYCEYLVEILALS